MLPGKAVWKFSKLTLQLLICDLCESAFWSSECDICNIDTWVLFFVENFATPSRKDSSEMAIS